MYAKRDLVMGSAISALTLACALAWAGPSSTSSVKSHDQEQPQHQHLQAKSATFTGIIIKIDDDYVLHDSAGTLYKLDDPNLARVFLGDVVKVTGQLHLRAMVIHVVSIEDTSA